MRIDDLQGNKKLLRRGEINKKSGWKIKGDTSKDNARATRCTGGDMFNGWDKISSAP